jgi:hypothetical protein
MFGTVLRTKLENVVSMLVNSRIFGGWRPSEDVVVDAVEDIWDHFPNRALQLVFKAACVSATMALYTLCNRVVDHFLQAQERSSDYWEILACLATSTPRRKQVPT